jgi:hypothetical protein
MKHVMKEPLTCFNETVSIRHNERWGKRSAVWMDYTEPKIVFPVYASTSGKGKLEIYVDSLLLYSNDFDLHKGLSYYPYGLQMDEDVAGNLEKQHHTDEPDAGIKPIKGDNGTYYLPPGVYTIRVWKEGHSADAKLEVKKRSDG